MNPIRVFIFLVIVGGSLIGLSGKFLIVHGYKFGIKVETKDKFFIKPFYINLQKELGNPKEITISQVTALETKYSNVKNIMNKYFKAIKDYIKCRENLYLIEDAVNRYLDADPYNKLEQGSIDWNKIYLYLPDYTIPECPSGGNYYLYKTNNKKLKVGCTNHITIEKPRIGF